MTLFENVDILALIGLTLVGGFLAGQISRRLGVPQVVGYIAAGVLLGPSLLHVVPQELNDNLNFVSDIALGLIGFEMGEHLLFQELHHLSKSILAIVFLEAFGALVLVTLGMIALTGQWATALILGSIAMATAPAATVDVLTEYDAQGPLTTTLLAVVGTDDALSLMMFSISAGLIEPMLAGRDSIALGEMLQMPLFEIGGSLVVGMVLGLILSEVMKYLSRNHDAMLISVAVVLVGVGLARYFGLSLILTTMTLGIVVINRDPKHGSYIRFTIENTGAVVYVLFFALAGARLHLDMLTTVGGLGIAYILLRITGKYIGTWIGSTLSHAGPTVKRYLGLALFSQAGVAIGLSLECCLRFRELGPEGVQLADTVLGVVTSTMLIVQIIGPILVKRAIVKAGEVGTAHTERSLAESTTPVSQVG